MVPYIRGSRPYDKVISCDTYSSWMYHISMCLKYLFVQILLFVKKQQTEKQGEDISINRNRLAVNVRHK